MPEIEWTPPAPRQGSLGAWDRFVGPGATSAEEWVQLVFGLGIAAACIASFPWSGGFAAGPVAIVVAIVLAADLGGGLVTNATAAAKRWYHRPGHGRAAHLKFVAVHGVHIAAVAAVFATNGATYFLVAYGYLMLASVLIVMAPLYLQRPVAMGLAGLGFALAQLPLLAVPGLDWFLPLLLLKLLVAHLLKEAPFARVQSDEATP
jgi:hypothetical protein